MENKVESQKHAAFNFIRYANCWEDADLLVSNLKPQKGDSILSIASAGDNSIAFLAFDPQTVLAFDINTTQLFLTELKIKAIKHLEYKEVLSFLGIEPSKTRTETYERIKEHLSGDARNYFDESIELIQKGILYSGKFENYFYKFRTLILPLIHSKKNIDKLFEDKSKEACVDFYEKVWNNWRWRVLFKLFFSKFIMGKYGRDPSFFNEVRVPVADQIYQRAEKHLLTQSVFQNHFLDFQLRGRFTVQLPFYLRSEHFETIKKNADKLNLFKGSLTDVPLEQKFNVLNLSNIFEYMDESTFEIQENQIRQLIETGSRIGYWNLLVERDLSKLEKKYRSETINGDDLCFFYKKFHLQIYNS